MIRVPKNAKSGCAIEWSGSARRRGVACSARSTNVSRSSNARARLAAIERDHWNRRRPAHRGPPAFLEARSVSVTVSRRKRRIDTAYSGFMMASLLKKRGIGSRTIFPVVHSIISIAETCLGTDADSGGSDKGTAQVLLETGFMSVRDKRFEALRAQHPHMSEKELRKLARETARKTNKKKRPSRTRKIRRDQRHVLRS